MTPDLLAAIEARAHAATEGPWKASDFGYPGQDEPSSIIIHHGDFKWESIDGGEFVAALPWDAQEALDATFIAYARTDVPALLAHVRDLEARLGRVADELHHAEDNGHRLDGNCQGVSPGQRIPAVRIDFIRAAITDESGDQA